MARPERNNLCPVYTDGFQTCGLRKLAQEIHSSLNGSTPEGLKQSLEVIKSTMPDLAKQTLRRDEAGNPIYSCLAGTKGRGRLKDIAKAQGRCNFTNIAQALAEL